MPSDLNASVGTVTRDASRYVGPGGAGQIWENPTLCNDGVSTTKAEVKSSLSAFTDHLVADLGAVYRVSAFKWFAASNPTAIDLPQWGESAAGPWHTIAVTETGPRSSGPDGATLAFDAGTIDARYWSVRAIAGGFHARIDLNTWQIIGDPIGDDLTCAFSATPTSGPAPLEVAFTDDSSGDPDGWLWDFGDGETSTEQNPTHVYAEPGSYSVTLTATRSSDEAECETTLVNVIAAVEAEAWDIYAADALTGPLIATLENASGRWIRSELHGLGGGGFAINRHAAEVDEDVLAEGNMVKVRIADCGPDYIDGFLLPGEGDYTLLSPRGGKGKELLGFRGLGALSYLDRARMTRCAFSIEATTTGAWTEVWKTNAVGKPVGVAFDSADPDHLYAIHLTTRKISRIDQATQEVVARSPALWSGTTKYAAGLSFDPDDPDVAWALEAPWLAGSAANTKIRKIDKSGAIGTWSVVDTFDLGSAVKLTDIRVDGDFIYTSRYDTDVIQQRSKTTGNVVDSSTITHNGKVQRKPNGIAINGTKIAYWFGGDSGGGTGRALIADTSDPWTITGVQKTTGISAFGGEWTTEGGDDFLYAASYTAGKVWKYQLTVGVPACADDSGVFHPEQVAPGALAWRILIEITHPDRPTQPCPELSFSFTEDEDSNGTPWPARTATEEFTWSVGDRAYSDVLARLIPAGVTFDLDVNTMTLHAYVDVDFGTDRTSATFAAGKVRFEEGVNLAVNGDLGRRDNRGQPDTDLTVLGDGGVYGSATLAGRYVREGFMQVSGPTTEAVLDAIGDDELARQRLVSDAIGFETLWGDGDDPAASELVGKYIPKRHYWKGDLVTVDMVPAEFSYEEAELRVYGTLITERDGGWRSALDLGSAYKIPPPVNQVPGDGGSSGGSGSGGGSSGGTTVIASIPLTVSDGEDVNIPRVTKIIAEGVTSPEAGVAILPSAAAAAATLRGLDDVAVDDVVDGQGIAWDDDLEAWVPVDRAATSGNQLVPEALITATKDVGNPTFDFPALVENIVKVGTTYYCPYINVPSAADIRLATATDRDGPWTAYDGTPLLALASIGWAAGVLGLYAPEIVEHDGTFYLFYAAIMSAGTTDARNAIGVATCATIDGTYVDSGAPILSPSAAGLWDSRRVGEPSVIYQGGQWVMAYMGEDSDIGYQESEKIGIATAPSPTGPWARHPSNPVLDFGAPGAWDDALVADPYLFYESGSYWIWYMGGLDSGPTTKAEEGFAYATDPLGTWTKHAQNPILAVGAPGAWDDVWVFRGGLFLEDGIWSGVYTGYDGVGYKGGNFRLDIVSAGEVALRAGDIPIDDAGGHYSSSEVEGALQEIGADLAILAAGGAGHYEVIVSGSSPPVAVETPDGTDWVYGFVPD